MQLTRSELRVKIMTILYQIDIYKQKIKNKFYIAGKIGDKFIFKVIVTCKPLK